MAFSVKVSTTGTVPVVTIPDLGKKVLVHPILDQELVGEYFYSTIVESQDLQQKVLDGELTIKLDDIEITDTRIIATGFGPGQGTSVGSDTFQVSAGNSNQNVTNSYLRAAGGTAIPTNNTPYVLPFNSTLYAIGASCSGPETWDGEIRIGGVLVPNAFISVSNSDNAYVTSLSVDFSAGDQLQFFCNGNAITKPLMTAFFRRKL